MSDHPSNRVSRLEPPAGKIVTLRRPRWTDGSRNVAATRLDRLDGGHGGVLIHVA
jgi:hypothetical protein